MWNFQEVIYGGDEPIVPEEYISNGHVTEFRYGTNMYNCFHSNDASASGGEGEGEENRCHMKDLQSFGESWNMLPSETSVTFLDNHDTQRTSSNVMTYKMGFNYD